jgi:hypothetical protein
MLLRLQLQAEPKEQLALSLYRVLLQSRFVTSVRESKNF